MADQNSTPWTPGPWAVARDVQRPYTVAVTSSGDNPRHIVCAGEPTGGGPFWPAYTKTTDPREANARLIAAAPALVEALEAVRRVVSPGRPLATFADLWHVCLDAECSRTVGSVVDAALAAARGEEEAR